MRVPGNGTLFSFFMFFVPFRGQNRQKVDCFVDNVGKFTEREKYANKWSNYQKKEAEMDGKTG